MELSWRRVYLSYFKFEGLGTYSSDITLIIIT